MTAVCFGQIVNIPNANFKNALLHTSCAITTTSGGIRVDVDSNNDGEIQVSEATTVTKLFIENNNITSLEGILSFTILEVLSCENNQLTQLSLSNLDNLYNIDCSDNNLTNLDLSGISSLLVLYCAGNELVNLDLSTNVNLGHINCQYNALATLNITGLSNLTEVNCQSNQLQNLDFHAALSMNNLTCNNNLLTDLILPQSLSFLNCSYNNLTSLVLPTSLRGLRCSHNQLTQLDLTGLDLNDLWVGYNQLTNLIIPTPSSYSQFNFLEISGNLYTSLTIPEIPIVNFICNETQLTSVKFTYPTYNANNGLTFEIRNNPNLQSIFMKNGDTYICYDPETCGALIENNPSLEFICLDDAKITAFPAVLQALQNVNNPNLYFTSYCSFTPGGNFNTTLGNVKFDFENNGCDLNDLTIPNFSLKISQNNTILGTTFCNNFGNYAVYSTETNTNTTLTPQFENPYFTVSPAFYISSFVDFGNTETANFCIVPNGIHNDLEAGVIAITPARPGFDATYKIVYKNKGTTTQSGTVTFNFNDFYSDFVSASSVPNNIQPDLLTWNFANLAPFETREITIVLNVNSPVEVPAVNAGDLLIFSSQVSGQTDETYMDNYANLTQVVVGSMDPNDKQVSALSYFYEYADVEDLYYTIRFQNLGTFAAENVVVADVLSNKLNANKLQMVSSSHPYVSRYNALTRKLEFIFEGINLPAAIDNEPGSHGYVSFKIKPVSTITLGQTIENKADIYFDFNAPVATNTTSTYIETLLKASTFENNTFTLHPNPAKHSINMTVSSGVIIQSIAIYNPLGQLVKTLTDDELSSSSSIDVTALKTGTYFMEINSNQGKTTKKFVKL